MLAYSSVMCFAAVYLDHRWLIDVTLGLTYAVAIYASVRCHSARPRRRTLVAAEEAAHA